MLIVPVILVSFSVSNLVKPIVILILVLPGLVRYTVMLSFYHMTKKAPTLVVVAIIAIVLDGQQTLYI